MKKTLSFFMLLLTMGVSFLWFGVARAAIEQPDFSEEFDDNAQIASALRAEVFAANPNLGGSTTTIDSIAIRLKSDNTCGWVLKIVRRSDLLTLNSNNVTTTAGIPTVAVFTFATSAVWHTGDLERFYLDAGNSIGGCTLSADRTGVLYGSATTTTYPNGIFADGSKNVKNLYFVLNGDGSGIASTTVLFSDTPPATCDFERWSVQVYANTQDKTAAEAAGGYNLGVRFGISNTTSTMYWGNQVKWCTGSGVIGSSLNDCDFTNFQFSKTQTLLPGVIHYAQAFISRVEYTDFSEMPESDLLAYSARWEFGITDVTSPTSTCNQKFTSPGIAMPTTTTSTAANQSLCNYDWPVNRVCDALVWLLYPSEHSINRFVDLKTDLQNKPPFGYVSVYKNELTPLVNSSTSATTTVDIGFVGRFTLFDTIRAIFGWLLYFTFAWWVFNRLRNFSLHG